MQHSQLRLLFVSVSVDPVGGGAKKLLRFAPPPIQPTPQSRRAVCQVLLIVFSWLQETQLHHHSANTAQTSMARWKAVLLFGLVLTAGLCRAAEEAEAADEAEDEQDYADEERAFLIVRKYVKEELAVQGRNITVHVEAYNAGNRCVSDGYVIALREGSS